MHFKGDGDIICTKRTLCLPLRYITGPSSQWRDPKSSMWPCGCRCLPTFFFLGFFFFFFFHFPAPYFPPCQATTELKIKGKKTKRQKDKKNQKEGVKKQPEERTTLDFVFHLFFFHFLQVSLQPNTASVRRRGPFEDEEIESLQCEIYKSSLRMSEETSKIWTHHTLPSSPIYHIKLLSL